jgi:quercetin dioxygenase-like cupin family protein
MARTDRLSCPRICFALGRFEVTIAGRTETLAAGGSFIVPSGLVHGVKALEAGRLIDSFTPHRADFLSL